MQQNGRLPLPSPPSSRNDVDGGDQIKERRCAAFRRCSPAPTRCSSKRKGLPPPISIQIFSLGILVNHLPSLVSSTVWLIHSADLVLPTSKESIKPYGSLILGVDPARMGADRTAFIFRRGHCITRIETRYSFDAMDTAGRQIIRAGAAVTGEYHRQVFRRDPAMADIKAGGESNAGSSRMRRQSACARGVSMELSCTGAGVATGSRIRGRRAAERCGLPAAWYRDHIRRECRM
jgi:hypothetical protein